MKAFFLQVKFFALVLLVGCNSNSKAINVEGKIAKPISVQSKNEKAQVNNNFNDNVGTGIFTQSKRMIFMQYGYPDKVTEYSWEYNNIKGFTSIEYRFNGCCDDVSSYKLIYDTGEGSLRAMNHIHVPGFDSSKKIRFKFPK